MNIQDFVLCLERLAAAEAIQPPYREAAYHAALLARDVRAEYALDWTADALDLHRAVQNSIPVRNDEDTGLWIAVHYFPHSPAQVYGLFKSEHDARAYAESQGFAKGGGAYDIQSVLNCQYQEDPSDYAGMGWIGKDGRP